MRCHYAQCRNFNYYYAEHHYAECSYVEFRYSDCRGAKILSEIFVKSKQDKNVF
jgi:hypothetical protein